MSRRLSLCLGIFLLFAAGTLTSGCAAAGSTKELPLARDTQTAAAPLDGTAPDSRSVGMEGRSALNVQLAPEDPLKRITAEPTGTIVGQRVNDLLSETLKLRESTLARAQQVQDVRGIGAASAIQYHSSVAAIEARLQQGTTPGNPILLRQWDDAQANLDQMSTAVSRLNTLSTDISSDGSTAGYILGSVKAALELSGAVDEDHDHLKILQDTVSQDVVQIERMKTEVSADLLRLNNYMTSERNNLQTLAFAIEKGEYLGNNLTTRPLIMTPAPVATLAGQTVQMAPPSAVQPVAAPVPAVYGNQLQPMQASPAMVAPMSSSSLMDPAARSGVGTGSALTDQGAAQPAAYVPVYDPMTQNLKSLPDESGSKTLAIIRFNDPNVQYEKQLYTAIAGAIDQQPNALFTIVAVTPQAGDATQIAAGTAEAQRHADDVKRSLIEMGLPPSRIAMDAEGDRDMRNAEVHVLVR